MSKFADLQPHPYADMFPYMVGADRTEFVSDIRQNGLQEQIILLDGKILDGRNRYRALKDIGEYGVRHFIDFEMHCKLANISPDPLQFVLSKNLHRRQLTESQRAMVAAALANMTSGRNAQSKSANLQTLPQTSVKEAAKQLNVSARSVADAKKVMAEAAPEVVEAVRTGDVKVSAAAHLASLSRDEQVDLIREAAPQAVAKVAKEQRDKKTADKKAKRAQKEQALAGKAVALPKEKFQVILTDDEWQFEPYCRETGMDRAADNHYPTSDMDALGRRDIARIAAKDCVLFMWATVPMLPQAIALMQSRGFAYKSNLVWVKEGRKGTGYWFRNCHELLLVGTRGDIPAPAMGEQADSVIKAPVGKHSEKPDAAYEVIERYYPNAKKIELNARRARPGWFVWGNEAPETAPKSEPETLPAKVPKMKKLAKAEALLGGDQPSIDAVFRPVPDGQPSVKDLLVAHTEIEHTDAKGKVQSLTVLKVNGPYDMNGATTFSIAAIASKKFDPTKNQKGDWFGGWVAVDGKILPADINSNERIRLNMAVAE
ncbi:MT-A70 family methyltransferase [Maritalea sp.]|uniref:MT-A70 family methyltransferase n=1 Tax=Maritalea sp. TaxID=2003361 RepID=UPI0039E3F67D